VDLYSKYKNRVQFVVIDLDRRQSPAQQELLKKYFTGAIPHVVVLDRSGKTLYNSAGEVEESTIEGLLDRALN
jgi:thioredoxin-related protein